jgi:hypothetical protein
MSEALDFSYTVEDTNEESAEDPDSYLYAMSDAEFETHLEDLKPQG